jgi:hypothetical protein
VQYEFISDMKRFLFENWRAKLMSLVVATAVWYLIRKNVDETQGHWLLDQRTPSESHPR